MRLFATITGALATAAVMAYAARTAGMPISLVLCAGWGPMAFFWLIGIEHDG